MKSDIKFVANICLTHEISGRFDLQCIDFAESIDYFNKYVQKNSSLQRLHPVIKDLNKVMKEIIGYKGLIGGLYSLDSLIDSLFDKINKLPTQTFCLLPGGWISNYAEHANCMLYQFTKKDDGSVVFRIYNSGDGLEYHEHTSSESNELYASIKTYTIDNCSNSIGFKALIKNLIFPLTQPEWDECELYRHIDDSLHFLNARLQPQDLTDPRIMTAHGLANTSSQNILLQFLKTQCANISEYNKTILDYKLFSIENYLKNNKSYRSATDTALLNKAITHIARIIQEPNTYPSVNEKSQDIEKVNGLLNLLNLPTSADTSPWWRPGILISSVKNLLPAKTISPVINKLSGAINDFEMISPDCEYSCVPGMVNVTSESLLLNLEHIMLLCEMCTNPLFCIEQIEKLVLQLPIPSSEQNYCEKIEFYNSIIEDVYALDRACNLLDQLSSLYQNAMTYVFDNAIVPTQIITCCSLFVLKSYLYHHKAILTNTPSFTPWLNKMLCDTLSGWKNRTIFCATNNPESDQRVCDLFDLVNSIIDTLEDPLIYYTQLFHDDIALCRQLISFYKDKKYSNESSEILKAIDILFNEIDENGDLLPTSILPIDQFDSLLNKLKAQLDLEKKRLSYFHTLYEKIDDQRLIITNPSQKIFSYHHQCREKFGFFLPKYFLSGNFSCKDKPRNLGLKLTSTFIVL